MTEDHSVATSPADIVVREQSEPAKYRPYKYRWTILALFFLVSLSSAFQWPMYVIVDNVIEEYYRTSFDTVNFTATVFLLCYVVFIYPATFLLHKWGLRFAVIVAAVGPCIASLIKLFSLNPDRLWIILLAQGIVGSTQTYVTVLPASIAATWFGADQVSTACGVASAGIQVAVAVGCLIPTLLFDGDLQRDRVETTLTRLHIGLAVFTTAVLLLIILFFKREPPTPPSETRLKLQIAKSDLTTSLREIVKDVQFLLFWLGYSAHIGIFYTMCFLLNPTVIKYYPNNVADVGKIGLLLMLIGVVGAAIFGLVLDKYRQFKKTAVVVNVLAAISIVAFTLTLSHGIAYVYIFQSSSGFFMTAAVSVGLEVGAEVTFPLPENVSSGFLLIGSKIFGFIFTTLFSYLFTNGFGIWTHVGMSSVVVFCAVLTVFVRFDLKRQAVHLNSLEKNAT